MAQATHASTHQEVLKDVPSAQSSFPTCLLVINLVLSLQGNSFSFWSSSLPAHGSFPDQSCFLVPAPVFQHSGFCPTVMEQGKVPPCMLVVTACVLLGLQLRSTGASSGTWLGLVSGPLKPVFPSPLTSVTSISQWG